MRFVGYFSELKSEMNKLVMIDNKSQKNTVKSTYWMGELIHFQGGTTLPKLFLLLSEKGSTLKGKNLLLCLGRPLSEGIQYVGMETSSQKNCLSLQNGRKSTKRIQTP